MTINVAHIGGGYFGAFQINAWLRMPDVELAAIACRDPGRRAVLTRICSATSIFSDLDEIIAAGTPVDILDVATPPDTHDGLIRSVLGKVPTIICQKPFTENLDQASALVAAAHQAGTRLIIHENFRFMPWYRRIHEEKETGSLGTIRQAHFRMRPGDGQGENAYLERQPYFRNMERFLIRETGIHWIDVFRFLFGEPDRVYADLWRSNPVITGEDSGIVQFTWQNGLRAILDANRTLDHQADNHRLTMGELLIEGDRATLRLTGKGELFLRHFGSNRETKLEYAFEDRDFGGDCVFHFQRHVIDALNGARPMETLASDYLNNMKIEAAIYQSSHDARAIML